MAERERSVRWLLLRVLAASAATAFVARDAQVGAGVAVLLLGWIMLRVFAGPPIVQLAFSYQWAQVMAGPVYLAATGRRLAEMKLCDYRPWVWVALLGLLLLACGLALGAHLLRKRSSREAAGEGDRLPTSALLLVHLALTMASGTLMHMAFEYPELNQPILTIRMARLGLIFLLFVRLLRPPTQWIAVVGLLLFEIGFGLSGYFASFREAFAMAGLALLYARRGRHASQVAIIGGLAVAALLLAVVWTGVKTEYRRAFRDDEFHFVSSFERLDKLEGIVEDYVERGHERWARDLDKLVARVWSIYYQALAYERVPAVLPHSQGVMLGEALLHVVTPRILWPEKGALASDSEYVRKYAGVWVAGERQGTSIAFGYFAQSYVDLGLPLAWLPSFLFGMLMGLCYRALQRALRHPELRLGATSAVFWSALYLYERSWIRTLGLGLTLIIVIGTVAIVLDRLLYWGAGLGPDDPPLRAPSGSP
jgi:hypothetical protein